MFHFSEASDQDELFDKIVTGDYEFISPFWDDISNSAKQLISRMLEINVKKRITAAEVLEHPWVAVSIKHLYPAARVSTDRGVSQINVKNISQQVRYWSIHG